MQTIRVGCVPDLPMQRLLSFTGAIYAHDPNLEVEVTHLPGAEQLERLRSGDLDLCLAPRLAGESAIGQRAIFPGERLAVVVALGHPLGASPAIRHEDLEREILLVAPRAANPALHVQLMALMGTGGLRFAEVRQVGGENPRDVLLAVGEGRGVTLGPSSLLRVAGEAASIVTARPLEPPQWMPDVTVAWLEPVIASRSAIVALAREVARELFG